LRKSEFRGTLTPAFDMDAVGKAADEYKAIKAPGG
jgi:hypothetical protein